MNEDRGFGLVLSRKIGESITIGDNIVVTVVKINRDGKVVLGFTCPREVEVVREELLRRGESR